MEKVAVIGGREFTNKKILFFALDEYNRRVGISLIISGGARGADTLAESYAKNKRIPYMIFPANWEKHGKSAGYIRNADIVFACDTVIAFPSKNSKGTYHTTELAFKEGKKVYILDKHLL